MSSAYKQNFGVKVWIGEDRFFFVFRCEAKWLGFEKINP
jgi:hypothetical protein